MIKSVRDNPPASVNSKEIKDMYEILYDDITQNGTSISYVDRHALGELAVVLIDMNNLRADVGSNGEAAEKQGDRNMVTKKNPARDALQKLYPVQARLFTEFKMTPASRGKNFSGNVENKDINNDGFEDI